MTRSGLAFASLLMLSACQIMSLDPTRQKIIDLTYPLNEATVFWPTEKGFVLEKESEGMTEKGYFYAANKFSSPEHGGTHVDAPHHFSASGRTVDQIPPEQLMGAAVLVDVAKKCAKDSDYLITVSDLTNWERDHGKIPAEAIVLLHTGFGNFWPDRKRYLGTEERGSEAIHKLHFPGLHPDAARWLIAERGIKAVGIDTASIDRGQSRLFETHRALFEKNVPAMENLANLDQLPATGFTIVALPMKIEGGSGAPLRVIAQIPN